MENPKQCDYCSIRPTTHVLWYLKDDYLYGKTGCHECVDRLARELERTDDVVINKVYDELGEYKVPLKHLSTKPPENPPIWH
jgi:hypothetical protein